MNAMGHNVPTMIGVDHRGVAKQITKLIPDYMVMGERGMKDMTEMEMPLPDNTAAMMTGTGPYGAVGMGGMFSVVKVRREQPARRPASPAPRTAAGLQLRPALRSFPARALRRPGHPHGARHRHRRGPHGALSSLRRRSTQEAEAPSREAMEAIAVGDDVLKWTTCRSTTRSATAPWPPDQGRKDQVREGQRGDDLRRARAARPWPSSASPAAASPPSRRC